MLECFSVFKLQNETAEIAEKLADIAAKTANGISLNETIRCLHFIQSRLDSFVFTRRNTKAKYVVKSTQLLNNLKDATTPQQARFVLGTSSLTDFDNNDDWLTVFPPTSENISAEDFLISLKANVHVCRPRRAMLMLLSNPSYVNIKIICQVGRIFTQEASVKMTYDFFSLLDSMEDFYDTAEFSNAYPNIYRIVTERYKEDSLNSFLSRLNAKLDSMR